MPNVGFIVALHAEVPFLFRDTAIVHQLHDNSIKVAISGMGQKRAGKTTISYGIICNRRNIHDISNADYSYKSS
jgi:hypothetical protein